MTVVPLQYQHTLYPYSRARAPRLTVEYFLLCVGVFLSPYLALRFDAAFITLSDIFFFCALLLMVGRGRLRPSPLGPIMRLWTLSFLLLFFGLFLGSMAKGDPVRGLIVAAQYFYCFMVLPFLLIVRDERYAFGLLTVFAAGVLLLDLHGIYTFFTSGYSVGSRTVSGAGRLATLLGNPNTAACLNAIVTVILLWLHRCGRLPIWCAWPAVAVTAVTVVLTSSNTGLFAMTVGLAVFLSGTLRPRQIVGVLILALCVGSGLAIGGTDFLPASFQKRVLSALTSGELSDAGTFVSRASLMQESIDIIAREGITLVGIGADQYRVVSALNAPVHNVLLILWTEGGLLSVAGWLLLSSLGVIVWYIARASGLDPLGRTAILAVFAVFAVAASATPHMYARYWFVALLLTMQPTLLALSKAGKTGRVGVGE